MVDDDDGNLLNFIGVKREKEWKPEVGPDTGDIKFAISAATLDQDIWHLQELLNNTDEVDEIELTQFLIDDLHQKKQLLKELLGNLPAVDAEEFKQLIERDLVALTYVERWKMYSFWRAEIMKKLATEVDILSVEVNQQTNELKDVETIETAEIIREAHIVGTYLYNLYIPNFYKVLLLLSGITTTGAAKQRALLGHLKSKIGNLICFYLTFWISKMNVFLIIF